MMTFDAVDFLEGLYATMETSDPTTVQPDHTADLSERWRELYEERAAIREFDGGQAREHAEAEAFREIVAMMKADAGGLAANGNPGVGQAANPKPGPAVEPEAGPAVGLFDDGSDPAGWAAV